MCGEKGNENENCTEQIKKGRKTFANLNRIIWLRKKEIGKL